MTFDKQNTSMFGRIMPTTAHVLTGEPTTEKNAAKPIPEDKRKGMVFRTFAAAVPIWGLTGLGVWLEWPQSWVALLGILGAVVASGQLVLAPLKDLVDLGIKAYRAFRGKDTTEPKE